MLGKEGEKVAIAPIDATFVELTHDERYGHTTGKLRIEKFRFESGETLTGVEVAFETWGSLSATRDNVVVVCHALTGDAHCAASQDEAGWWEGLIGPGLYVDTTEKFVIASNVLGGCAGSTGPASRDESGIPYALRFPLLTIRDIVRAQIFLVDALGIERVDTVIGGSLGGMQAWEWPLLAPGRVKNTVVIAAQPAFSALGIGYNEAMRQAIVSDSDWNNGDYYQQGRGPARGLMAARSIGMLTYRSQTEFEHRFGREGLQGLPTGRERLQTGRDGLPIGRDGLPSGGVAGELSPALSATCARSNSPLEAFTKPQFSVESYLHHHGEKLFERFDANSYLYLTRAMDTHDVGRGRGGIKRALALLQTRLTVVGIDTDYLFDSAALANAVGFAQSAGVDAHYLELKSVYGHDAFLIEQDCLATILESAERGVCR